ncbi:MAG TPA: TraR/DksA C4-type zinc finger protein [Ilumatobacteraceae bacterium]|nr:TraR/DksA C4-type zinc finger protein [Ilumatobacteraceae bacterium]
MNATSSSAENNTKLRERLNEELRHAEENLVRLEAEYEGALADHDMLQEDRDSIRTLLEGARAIHEHAQSAVDRLDHGQYGTCTKCGKKIPEARLEALPDVATCVSCS